MRSSSGKWVRTHFFLHFISPLNSLRCRTLGYGGDGGCSSSGGGGGGYYGGGGGTDGGTGAGGSSISFGFNTTYTTGFQTGDGSAALVFLWSPSKSFLYLLVWLPLNELSNAMTVVPNYRFGIPSLNGQLRNGSQVIAVPASDSMSTRFPTALYLPGSGAQYLQLPAFTTTNSGLSICFWFKRTVDTVYTRIFDFSVGNTGNNNILVQYEVTAFKLYVMTNAGASSILGPSTCHLNVWCFISLVMSPPSSGTSSAMASTWKLYVNGTLFSTISNQYYPEPITRYYNYLGKSTQSSLPYFTGWIADFRLYSAVIEYGEIQDLFFTWNQPTSQPSSQPTTKPSIFVERIGVNKETWMLQNYAGSGYLGFDTENTSRTSADLYTRGIYGDSLGNLYFGSVYRVAKIDARTNKTTTVAGTRQVYTGSTSYPVIATSAWIGITDIWVDSMGVLYILDYGASAIREVKFSTGILRTYFGASCAGYSPDNTTATSACLNSAWNVIGDSSGNLFFTERAFNQYRVRKISRGSTLLGTIAGSGGSTFSGENGPATSATIGNPWSLAIDTMGNIYIADVTYHRILLVTKSTGLLTTYAGTGNVGYNGDNMLATAVNIEVPFALWVNTMGVVFYSDFYRIVRKISPGPNKVVTTIAGNMVSGYGGDGGNATLSSMTRCSYIWGDTLGNIFISDDSNLRIRRISHQIISTYAGTGRFTERNNDSPATSSQLLVPRSVWMNSNGLLYIADFEYERNYIRTVTNDGLMSIFAGYSYFGYSPDGTPITSAHFVLQAIWGDTNGNIFFIDLANVPSLRKISSSNILSTISGGTNSSTSPLPLTSARLPNPYCIWGDSLNNIFMSDIALHIIRRVSIIENKVTTYVGKPSTTTPFIDNVAATSATLNTPIGVWLDSNYNLFIGDQLNHRIRKVSPNGLILTYAGTGNAGPGETATRIATRANLYYPSFLCGDSLGVLYVSEYQNRFLKMIFPYNHTVVYVSIIAGNGDFHSMYTPLIWARSSSISPTAVTVGPDGAVYFANDFSVKKLFAVDNPSGQPTSEPSSQPSRQPSRQPSSQPSRRPTSQPSSQPSCQPSSQPSARPSRQPTAQPSRQPSASPSAQPTSRPSQQPSAQPSGQPTTQPISSPTMQPSSQPTCQPSRQPSTQPTVRPSSQPSSQPNCRPSSQPSAQPSKQPIVSPSTQPTSRPSRQPSSQPSHLPTTQPTTLPTKQPSSQPTIHPTMQPSCRPSTQPSSKPTLHPSAQPSSQPSSHPSSQPSGQPNRQPSVSPSTQPSSLPSPQPSSPPSRQPTAQPTTLPTIKPSQQPSTQPSDQPNALRSGQPSSRPSLQPSVQPSRLPTTRPTTLPTMQPFSKPSTRPTGQPSSFPSRQPSSRPSQRPSSQPSTKPTSNPSQPPSSLPTMQPSSRPSTQPTCQPVSFPSARPSYHPSTQPSTHPSTQPSVGSTASPSCQPSSCPSGQSSSLPTDRPAGDPTAQPTSIPTVQPFSYPSSLPTVFPLVQPTAYPSHWPSSQPSTQPSREPIAFPSAQPSLQPSDKPTSTPTTQPSARPTILPVALPSSLPTTFPSSRPSLEPRVQPSISPSGQPTATPTMQPSGSPSSHPSEEPSSWPTLVPTSESSTLPSSSRPSTQPTSFPSNSPILWPSALPTEQPMSLPSFQPTVSLTELLSSKPSNNQPISYVTVVPSFCSASLPSSQPSSVPTCFSSGRLLSLPTSQPGHETSAEPSVSPSEQPSAVPLPIRPSSLPSSLPSSSILIGIPSSFPLTTKPSSSRSSLPSLIPTFRPSLQPSTSLPTKYPSSNPSLVLNRPHTTLFPSSVPSTIHSRCPSSFFLTPSSSSKPIGSPLSFIPSKTPTRSPTMRPSRFPTLSSTQQPSSRPSSSPLFHSLSPACSPSSSIRPSRPPVTRSPTVAPTRPFSLHFNSSVFRGFLFLLGQMPFPLDNNLNTQDFSMVPVSTSSSEPSSFIVFGKSGNHWSPLIVNKKLIGDGFVAIETSLMQEDKESSPSSSPRIVQYIGDINGDDIDDIAVGYPMNSICFVYYGTTSPRLSLPLSFTIHGELTGDGFGWAISTAGDMNDDEIADFLVSAVNAGIVYLLFGQQTAATNSHLYLSQLLPSQGIKIIGNSQLEFNVGMSVSSAGDFNGDGHADLLISAMNMESSLQQSIVYVLLCNGSSSFQSSSIHLNQSTSLRIVTPSMSFAGLSVAGLGDVNGDGLGDAFVGSLPYKSGAFSGTQLSFVIYGRRLLVSDTLILSPSLSSDGFVIEGAGFTAAPVGDVSGDGIDDFLVVSYLRWQGREQQAYYLALPAPGRGITSAPSPLPSSNPSSTLSMTPSSRPTVATTTFPTNSPSLSASSLPSPNGGGQVASCIPTVSLSPTRAPVSKRPTPLPSHRPSIIGTRSPSMSPSLLPSLLPTFQPITRPPSCKPSLRPSRPVPASRAPSTISPSFPSSSPLYDDDDNVPVLLAITAEGTYTLPDPRPSNGTDSLAAAYLISVSHGNVVLSGDSSDKSQDRRKFIILPNEDNRITITDFRAATDLIDLSNFQQLRSIGDLSFSVPPLALHLSAGQEILLPSLTGMNQLTAANFLFSSSSSSESSSVSAERSSGRVDSTLIISLTLLLVLGFLISLLVCVPSSSWSWKDEVDIKEMLLKLDDEDEQDPAEDCGRKVLPVDREAVDLVEELYRSLYGNLSVDDNLMDDDEDDDGSLLDELLLSDDSHETDKDEPSVDAGDSWGLISSTSSLREESS